MINNLNRSAFMGYLGPDAKQVNATAPVTFSIAVSSHWTDNAGDRHPYPAMSFYPAIPDACYFVVRGRLWRCSNPHLSDGKRDLLIPTLMATRRAKGTAMRSGNKAARERAKRQVVAAKTTLGERGPVWWKDGASDVNRHMAKNTLYAAWFAAVEREDHG